MDLVEWLRGLSLTGTTVLEPRDLCQLLVLGREEGPAAAAVQIDPREMCTVRLSPCSNPCRFEVEPMISIQSPPPPFSLTIQTVLGDFSFQKRSK